MGWKIKLVLLTGFLILCGSPLYLPAFIETINLNKGDRFSISKTMYLRHVDANGIDGLLGKFCEQVPGATGKIKRFVQPTLSVSLTVFTYEADKSAVEEAKDKFGGKRVFPFCEPGDELLTHTMIIREVLHTK